VAVVVNPLKELLVIELLLIAPLLPKDTQEANNCRKIFAAPVRGSILTHEKGVGNGCQASPGELL
jgi:hypothetical protein